MNHMILEIRGGGLRIGDLGSSALGSVGSSRKRRAKGRMYPKGVQQMKRNQGR